MLDIVSQTSLSYKLNQNAMLKSMLYFDKIIKCNAKLMNHNLTYIFNSNIHNKSTFKTKFFSMRSGKKIENVILRKLFSS